MKEFESHLAEEYIEAMPTEMFVEMHEGRQSFSDLEAIARSHDGSRDSYDVRKDRVALDKKIIKEALTEASVQRPDRGQAVSRRIPKPYRRPR